MKLLNKNMKWIIFLIIILLISGPSGCSFLSETTGGDDASGLIMSFEPGRPPSESGRILYEDDPFQVAVNLKNTGSKPISGDLCVSDVFLYTGYGGVPEPECKMVTLGGYEEGVEPSEQTIFFPDELNGYAYNNLDKYFSQQDTITASFKYDVNSKSAAQICIKSDIDSKLPSGISCPYVETISGDNIQNMKAPIIVSSIKKEFSSSGGTANVNVEIIFKKITDGDVMDIINYDIGFDGGAFKCGERGGKIYFEPYENEKVIKCSSKINIGQDYIIPLLEINLNYLFKKSIWTQMELKKEA